MRGNMKAERYRRGLRAEEVAKAVGVSANSILRWESGETSPIASNLTSLADFYGVSSEYLIADTTPPRTPMT